MDKLARALQHTPESGSTWGSNTEDITKSWVDDIETSEWTNNSSRYALEKSIIFNSRVKKIMNTIYRFVHLVYVSVWEWHSISSSIPALTVHLRNDCFLKGTQRNTHLNLPFLPFTIFLIRNNNNYPLTIFIF